MAFKIFLCSHFMLNTQFLAPLSKKKKEKKEKEKRKKCKFCLEATWKSIFYI